MFIVIDTSKDHRPAGNQRHLTLTNDNLEQEPQAAILNSTQLLLGQTLQSCFTVLNSRRSSLL